MSKAARQRSARERLAEERKRQAEKQKKMRALLVSVGALVLIGIVVVAVVLVQSDKDDSKSADVALAPISRQADGSVVMAKAGVEAPVLDVYEDFQCPGCKAFESATSKTVKQLASEGKVKVVYRPFSLFRESQEPTKGNSARALNASFCAPADKWMAYHDILYKKQGPENSKGFENKELISWAGDAGISGGGFDKCVNGTEKTAMMDQANAAAVKAGVKSTPWVLLNGKQLDQNATFTPDGLRKAVESVPAQAPAPAPSGSPSPGKSKAKNG